MAQAMGHGQYKEPANRLHLVHKGAGIRKDGLHRSLGASLRAIWQIDNKATATQTREIVLLRLKAVLDTFTMLELPEIVWTAYNLGAGSLDSGMTKRLEELGKDGAKGFSLSSCHRKLAEFREAVIRSFEREQPLLRETDLRNASLWLQENARPDHSVSSRESSGVTNLYNTIRGMRDPEQAVIDQLLQVRICGLADSGGKLIPARLGADGDWVCVFTDEYLFREYRAAAKANWPHTSKPGHEIIREAARGSMGVLINPSHRLGTGIDATLPLPSKRVAEIAASL
jgi:hypothetical protein